LERGNRNQDTLNPRKRRPEYSVDYNNRPKRPRDQVVDLSSEDGPPAIQNNHVIIRTTPSLSPLPVPSSSSDESIAEDSENEFDEEDMTVPSLSKIESSSGQTSRSTVKGKEKETFSPSALELQEELECSICGTALLYIGLTVANILMVPHICCPCGHGACGPCGMFLGSLL
jgi:hypothetical protein